MENSNVALHLRIAEQGKVYSIEGNYQEALKYYQEAMKMLENDNIQGKDVFFQHYSQCIMEALERAGKHEEVLNYCDKYLTFLNEKEEPNEWIATLKAHMLEKSAIQYLWMENKEAALDSFKEVKTLLGQQKTPITDQLLTWLQRGYTISQKQIKDLLDKHAYYIVLKGKVNPKIAMKLPDVAMSTV